MSPSREASGRAQTRPVLAVSPPDPRGLGASLRAAGSQHHAHRAARFKSPRIALPVLMDLLGLSVAQGCKLLQISHLKVK